MDLGLTHGIGQLLNYAYSFDVGGREKSVDQSNNNTNNDNNSNNNNRPVSPSGMISGEPTLEMLRKLSRCMKQAEEEK